MNSRRKLSYLISIFFIISFFILSNIPQIGMIEEADALSISFTFQIDLNLDTVDSGSFEFFIGVKGLSASDKIITVPFDRNEVENSVNNQMNKIEIPIINYDLRELIIKIWEGSLDFIGQQNIDKIGQMFLLYFLGIDKSISDFIEIAKEEIKIYLSGGIGFHFDFDLHSGREIIEYQLFSFLKTLDDKIGKIILGKTLCNLLDFANTGVSMFAGTKLISIRAIVKSSSGISLEKNPTNSIDLSSYRLQNGEKRVIDGKFSDFSQKSIGDVTVGNSFYNSPNILFYLMILIIIIIVSYILFLKYYIKKSSGRIYLLVFSIPVLIQSYFYPWNLFNDYLFYIISILVMGTIITDTFWYKERSKYKIKKFKSQDKAKKDVSSHSSKIVEIGTGLNESERLSAKEPTNSLNEGYEKWSTPVVAPGQSYPVNTNENNEIEESWENEEAVNVNEEVEENWEIDEAVAINKNFKYCIACGNKIDRIVKFCPDCGNKQ